MLERHRLERDLRLQPILTSMLVCALASVLCLIGAFLTDTHIFVTANIILAVINGMLAVHAVFRYFKVRNLYK